MANFNTHLGGAFSVSGILAVTGYKAGLLSDTELVLCTCIGTVGGLLPDIDSDNSSPLKVGFDIISLIISFTLMMQWREMPLFILLGIWLGTYIILRYALFASLTQLTKHRGVIHSVPYMAVCSLALTCGCYYYLSTPAIVSWYFGWFLFIGSMVHLVLDEIYGVNLLDKPIDRPLGSAFKIYYHPDRYFYAAVYVILAALIFVSPPFSGFWQGLTDPITMRILEESLTPSSWF